MRFGTRNSILAEVIEIRHGDVMCEVRVRLKSDPTTQMSSVMTEESLHDLDIAKGDTVRVVVKVVNVLLAKD